MSSDPAVQAAARIAELENELATQKAADIPRLRARLAELEGRLVELEGLLAPPPDERGIRYGMYYRTTDAMKHKTLPDAVLRQNVLDLMEQGMSEGTANRLTAAGWYKPASKTR